MKNTEEKQKYLKEYYLSNKERLRTHAVKYRKENGKRLREERKVLKMAKEINNIPSLSYIKSIYVKCHPMGKEFLQEKGRSYRKRNKEVIVARAKIWYQQHREEVKKQRLGQKEERARLNRQWRLDLKIEVLTYYGNGECSCITCGERRIPCLSIDHIDNNGCEHRRQLFGKPSNSIYYWLKKNNYPEGYQTLCMNCQFVKQAEHSGWYAN